MMSSISFDDLPDAAPQQAPKPVQKQQEKKPTGFLQAADDIIRLTANGLTGGYADKLASWGNGTPVEQERAKSQEASDRAGLAGDVAGFAGTIAGPGKLMAGGARLLTKAPVVGGLLSRPIAQAATEGAGIGAFDAAGHDQPLDEGAGFGAAAGVGGNLAARGISSVVKGAGSLLNKNPHVPTLDELERAKSLAYKRAENSGGFVNGTAMSRLSDELKNTARSFAYHPTMQPKSAAFFNALEDYDGKSVSMKDLETLRRIVGRTHEGDKSDRELGRLLRDKIDEFTAGITHEDLPRNVLPGSGDPMQAAALFRNARDLAQRSFKASDIEEALGKADRRTMRTGVGGNEDNVIRQNIDKLVNSKTAWSPDEKAALEEVVLGTPLRNTARHIGKLSPVGNSLTAMLEGIPVVTDFMNGNVHAALPIMAAGGVGFASKKLADALTRNAAERAGDLVRAGGKASALNAAPNAIQRLADSKKEALARALLAGSVNGYFDTTSSGY